MRLLVPCLLPAMLAASSAVAEQSWPQFRGPRGDGTSMAKDVPLNWSETNNLAWKVAVPGRGRSSPIVMEDRIWLTTALERGVKRTSMYAEDMQTAEHAWLQRMLREALQRSSRDCTKNAPWRSGPSTYLRKHTLGGG